MLDILTRQYRKITINNTEYQISLLKGREGFTTALTLGKLMAPVVGGVFDGVKHDDLIHGAPRTFTDIAMVLINQIDKVDVESLIFEKLLRGLAANGQAVDFDKFFMGNYSELVELIIFSLKENFGDFFGENGFKARFQETVSKVLNPT